MKLHVLLFPVNITGNAYVFLQHLGPLHTPQPHTRLTQGSLSGGPRAKSPILWGVDMTLRLSFQGTMGSGQLAEWLVPQTIS